MAHLHPEAVTGALDLSLTSTGLALGTEALHRIRPSHRDLRGPARIHDLATQLLDLIPRETNTLIIEGASYGSDGKGRGQLIGAHWAIRTALWERGMTTQIAVPPSTLKKWATGSGRATKDDMVDAANKLGYQTENHDVADAAHLHHFGKVLLDPTQWDRHGTWATSTIHRLHTLALIENPNHPINPENHL